MRRIPQLNHRQVLALMRNGQVPKIELTVVLTGGAQTSFLTMQELEAQGQVVRVGEHWELK